MVTIDPRRRTMIIPNDLTDLYLAPVLLEIEARIDRLSRLEPAALSLEVALTSDAPDWDRGWREHALAAAITHLIDLHGWEVTVEGRSLRLAHRQRAVVIALPQSLEAFLAGPKATDRLVA
jgi:hypothetical protein